MTPGWKSFSQILTCSTGDEKLDQAFRGYRRVLTGYREEMAVKVE